MKISVPDAVKALKNDHGLPDLYFEFFDGDELLLHHHYLDLLSRDPLASFSFNGDCERFTIHRFDTAKACAGITGGGGNFPSGRRLFRIFAKNSSPGFMIIADYKDLPDAGENGSSGDGKPFFSVGSSGRGTVLTLRHSNISLSTLVRNVFETFSAYRIFPQFSEICETKGEEKRVRNIFRCVFHFEEAPNPQMLSAVEADFTRYLQTNIRPMSVFDIIGPSMAGPSSSHTAGACRIGQISRNILEALKKGGAFGRIDSISVKLLGSFRDTGVGHRTPSAIAGGLQGFAPDDKRAMESGDPLFLKENPIEIAGDKAFFKGFLKGSADDDKRYEAEKSGNMAEIIADTDKGRFSVTGFSLGGGNVEIRYLNGQRLQAPLTGKEDAALGSLPGGWRSDSAIEKAVPGSGFCDEPRSLEFNTFEEVEAYCLRTNKTLLDAALESEMKLRDVSEEGIYSEMEKYWRIMKEGVAKGLKNRELSPFKLTGGDAAKVNAFLAANGKFDNIFGKAVAYATAVSEINAKSCVIVAAPTAGSCGIIPGILKAYEETAAPPEKKILEALIIAGFFGMILFDDVSTAGADYGCQAEVGAGAAMAAAAVAHIEGGTTSQVVQSFTLALKNCMGLVCDPVAGLVEVPCVKRNGIYTSVALSSALMALSGVASFVSPDEVVLAVREVGERLHRDYKETAGGGLARTRDGQRVAVEFEKEVGKFFKE